MNKIQNTIVIPNYNIPRAIFNVVGLFTLAHYMSERNTLLFSVNTYLVNIIIHFYHAKATAKFTLVKQRKFRTTAIILKTGAFICRSGKL